MKERPINLSAWEVRAILAGRKTQLRRMIALTSHGGFLISVREPERWPYRDPNFDLAREESDRELRVRCPFGAPGDLLWGREAHKPFYENDTGYFGILFRDGRSVEILRSDPKPGDWLDWGADRWRPSSHMFRWMSRITLQVEQVRVQRVQEISEEDAEAEGENGLHELLCVGGHFPDPAGYCVNGCGSRSPIESFSRFWDSIHGPNAWDRNDWVWALTFRRTR